MVCFRSPLKDLNCAPLRQAEHLTDQDRPPPPGRPDHLAETVDPTPIGQILAEAYVSGQKFTFERL